MPITDHIKKGFTIAIIAHIRPDGDAFGSAFCIRELCNIQGATGYILCDGAEMPEHYSFIKDYESVNTAPKDIKYDLCIAVDCADPARMGKYKVLIETLPTINIDHHKTNPKFGTVDYIFPQACSTCEIVFDLLKDAGVEITKTMAEYLYIGLSTDTGNFCHSNTTSKVHRIAAELIDRGVYVTPINTALYKSNTLNNTRLKAKAIANLILFEDGKIAFTGVQIHDLKECGCKLNDTEGLIDIPNNLKGVEAAICIAEQKQNVYKVSFRSRDTVDVSLAAGVFGGGGHARAAGCMTTGKFEIVMDKVVSAVKQQFE